MIYVCQTWVVAGLTGPRSASGGQPTFGHAPNRRRDDTASGWSLAKATSVNCGVRPMRGLPSGPDALHLLGGKVAGQSAVARRAQTGGAILYLGPLTCGIRPPGCRAAG